jgi:uncharacterized membrane protein
MFFLLVWIGGKRGIKLFISLVINFIILMIAFYFIALGFNPIVISLIGCLIITYIILYFVNGESIKTKASLISVIIVLLILVVSIFIVTTTTKISGFGYESYEEINMFSYDVDLDFTNVSIALILIGLIGATVDTSVAISSALYEVYQNNKNLSKKELFLSGITIGKDILGTTTNTLLFAFLGEFLTLLIWFKDVDYSLLDIINNKTFCAEFIKILFSGMGCILVIPITSLIVSNKITNKKNLIIK